MASTALLNGNGIANGHMPHVGPNGSSKSASTERIQIVNEEKNFTLVCSGCFIIVSLTLFSRPDLAAQIDKWGLRDSGFAYNIVSVFGSQSTGKSKWDVTIDMQHLISFRTGTLLNRLFGTTFDVMDETKRQQTTKGLLYLFYIQCQCKTSLRHLDVSRRGYERHGHGR